MANVGVVICNYSKVNDVLACIKSVLENTYKDIHIYVVDNASEDESVERIIELYSEVENMTLIQNEENVGAGAGFNVGLRQAVEDGCNYLMCVDNDALLDIKCIEQLVNYLDMDEESGIAAAKIFHMERPTVIQHFGMLINWKEFDMESVFFDQTDDDSLSDVVFSDAVPTCVMMIRKSVIEKIGYIPEENFIYWDDMEWCVRCTMAGYQVATIPKAMALHPMTTKECTVDTMPAYYGWRNWITFFMNHTPNTLMDSMVDRFLNRAFHITYSGKYRGEHEIADTVMIAIDDALHGITGVAGENRIFPIEKQISMLQSVADRYESIVILENHLPNYAQKVRKWIERYNPDREVLLISPDDDSQSEWKNRPGQIVLDLCDSIFEQEDLSLQTCWLDVDGNLLETKEQIRYVLDYPIAKEYFIFAHKPLFEALAYECRK